MPAKTLQEFLDSHHARYTTINHPLAYTAQEIAATAHIRGREMAKTVMIKVDGAPAMAVLPADHKINFARLREMLHAHRIDLMSEWEFGERFSGCEVGAMPPFGNLYGMDVIVEDSLADDEEIAFNAGTHTELVKIAYREFERLTRPRVMPFSN